VEPDVEGTARVGREERETRGEVEEITVAGIVEVVIVTATVVEEVEEEEGRSKETTVPKTGAEEVEGRED
jgi:hypothetical protein